MATKLEFEEVMMVINQNVKDPETKKSLLADLRQLEADKVAEKESEKEDNGPKQKNKHVFFVRRDKDGKYADAGFLAKASQDSDTSTILSRLQKSAAQQNDAKNNKKSNRGRKSKGGAIQTFYDFFHGAKRKFTKENDIAPMKELVQVVVLESDEIDFSK